MSETLIGKAFTNSFSFPGGFVVQADKPIDDRLVVHSVASLTAEDTFVSSQDGLSKAYNGMVVSVLETNDLYILTDVTNITNINSWEKINVPKFTNADIGRLLTIVEINTGTTEAPVYKYEAQWIEAPSGLPDMESEDGKFLTVVKDETSGTYFAQWIDVPNELPTISEEEDGKFLTVEKDTTTGNYVAKWINVPNELPAISKEVSNKILQVKSDGSGVMWVDTPDELPTFTSSDNGRVLTVTSNGSKIEWKTVEHPSELPGVKTNELKFLQVGENGIVRWADPLPPVEPFMENVSFLGNDINGTPIWKPYQYKGTYDELMSVAHNYLLVPGGTYILKDYSALKSPFNAFTDTFDELFSYCIEQYGLNEQGEEVDPLYLQLYAILNHMFKGGEISLVDIVLRADSTNSFERKAKMTSKSREYISMLVYDVYAQEYDENERKTMVNRIMNVLPNITADIEIEMDPSKLDMNDCLIYGLGDTTGNLFPGFKGVITYMKDSFGNEMPFDFKTVLITQETSADGLYRSYIFTNNHKPVENRVSYICDFDLSNNGKMRDVRYIIDDREFYGMFGKICYQNNTSIYNRCSIRYCKEFNQVSNLADFNSGSNTLINNVEIHNNSFAIQDTLINGLKIFNDNKTSYLGIIQDVNSVITNGRGINIINVLNASLILNNVTFKNSAQILTSLRDNVGMNGISFTFPADPWTGKATMTEIRKILRNITIDLPNDFSNYRLLMNGEYLTNFDAMPGDYPTICAYDHMIELSRQMAELIKSKSNQLELTSESYKNDLHKAGGHNDFQENLIQKITDDTYVSLMAPLSFGEFLGFKYPTTDTSGGESPVFTLLNLLRDAEKTYRLVVNPNGELVFKLQVPQFDDTTATSVVELGI